MVSLWEIWTIQSGIGNNVHCRQVGRVRNWFSCSEKVLKKKPEDHLGWGQISSIIHPPLMNSPRVNETSLGFHLHSRGFAVVSFIALKKLQT